MTGSAVVTTRLSSATMNNASELMMKAHAGLDRVLVMTDSTPVTDCSLS